MLMVVRTHVNGYEEVYDDLFHREGKALGNTRCDDQKSTSCAFAHPF